MFLEQNCYLCIVINDKEVFKNMKYSELKRKLKKQGCFLLREGSRHEIWINPENGNMTSIGRHDQEEVKEKTLHTIYKELFGA